MDWSRDGDYDPLDAEWHDATTIGSAYEQQIDIEHEGVWRHRSIADRGAWVKGPAPS